MNDDLRELQKEELLAKLKELQAFLVKESDESISKADPHKPFKDYYEGAFRAYELAVYKMYDIFGLEPPKGWGKPTSPKLENFSPRPMREVEYFGEKISIPVYHKCVATCADGSIYSYVDAPEYKGGIWTIGRTDSAAVHVVGYCINIGEHHAVNSLRIYPN